MNSELLSILDHIERDRGIDKEVLIQAVESALLSAAKKAIKGKEGSISVKFDRETGNIEVCFEGKPVKSDDFGRIAAQTAKQVIIQKIREAERDVIYKEFKGKLSHIVTGTIYRFERFGIVLNLGKTEGVILKKLQIPREEYKQGQRLRAYVESVEQDNKGPQIILSRTNPNFIKCLFELEVPEIYERIVEIKSIARQPGERTKIAVYSHDDKVDSVGACVGVRGSRVKDVVREVQGEKIDIVRWSSDIKEFIKNALSPAEVMEIKIDSNDKNVLVLVNDDQLSLAIGKHGQNVKLASELTGRNINIKSASEISKGLKEKKEKNSLKDLKGVGKKTSEALLEAKITSLEEIAKLSVEELVKIPGIGKKTAEKIIKSAKDIIGE